MAKTKDFSRDMNAAMKEALDDRWDKLLLVLDAALESKKTAVVACPRCKDYRNGKEISMKSVTVEYEDVHAAIQAMKFLADYGLAKPKEKEAPLPVSPNAAIEDLSDADLARLAST